MLCQIQALSFDLNKDEEEDSDNDDNDGAQSSEEKEEKPDTEMLEAKWRDKEEPVSLIINHSISTF